MATPLAIAGYLALFASIGFLFLFGNLLLGRLVRPKDPHPEKLEIYECGEPTIGSSFVQFDLRFYVVALLFIIFDVEVAFFFPWATVFGKATHLMDPADGLAKVTATGELNPAVAAVFNELGVRTPTLANTVGENATSETVTAAASQLAWLSFYDILVFFAVLMLGFAYVWKRGDLDWVRAVSKQRAAPVKREQVRIAVVEETPTLTTVS